MPEQFQDADPDDADMRNDLRICETEDSSQSSVWPSWSAKLTASNIILKSQSDIETPRLCGRASKVTKDNHIHTSNLFLNPGEIIIFLLFL